MRLHLSAISLLFVALAASAPAEETPRKIPAPPLADGSVIRLAARTIGRGQTDTETVFDLEGEAGVFGHGLSIRATRLRVWMRTEETGGKSRALLDVYYEAGAVFTRNGVEEEAGRPGMLRLTSGIGLTMDGRVRPLAPEAQPEDFVRRAERFRVEGPPSVAGAGTTQELLAHFQPSAEELLFEDFVGGAGATVTFYGNAEILYEGMRLRADVLRFRVTRSPEDPESVALESVYAEGAVELDLESQRARILARAVTFDVRTGQGIALDARVRLFLPERNASLQFGGDAVRVLDEYHFRIEGRGFATTSEMAEPHYRLQAGTVDIVREPPSPEEEGREPSEERSLDARVTARRNFLFVETLPVFWWPYISKDISSRGMLLRRLDIGHRGTWGNFGKAEWALGDLAWFPADWLDPRLRTDFYSERGAGIGLNLDYRTPARRGYARTYYINDYAAEDDRNLPVPRNRRGELTFLHREMLPEDFQLDLEVGWLSDRRFLRTYDRDEFDEGKDRRTAAFLRRPHDNLLFTAQAQSNLNDFDNSVERIGTAFHFFGEPLFDGPVLFTGHADISRLRLRTDDALGLPNQDPVTRFDSVLETSVPFSPCPGVRFDPFVEGTYTAYSRQAAAERNDRATGAYGARAAMNFSRTFDAENEFLDIARIRHVLTPTVEYKNVFAVTRGPGYFVQHDEVDARDAMHRTTVGLRNRLQTYRAVNGEARIVDFATLDTDYCFHHRDTGADRGLEDFLEWSASWRVTEYLTLLSNDNRYNTEAGRLDTAHGEVELHFLPPVRVLAGHLYFVDVTDPALPRHSISTLRVVHQPKYSRWRTEIKTAYDFQPHRRPGDLRDTSKLGTGLYLTRHLEGWEVTLGAAFNEGRANETTFSIQVRPPGRSPWIR